MFLELLKKECAQYLKSIIYYIFLFCLAADFISQMGEFETVVKPEYGLEDYGMTRTEDKDVIMQNGLENLLWEYERNEYTTYPIGFYKRVTLNEKEQEQVTEILSGLTGLTETELNAVYEEYNRKVEEVVKQVEIEGRPIFESEYPKIGVTVKDGISYDAFLKEMKAIDDLLGGGSKYSESDLKSSAMVPKTYEQALKEYDSFIKKDKITNAYARLFCDYLGIMLAILPVFLSVTRALSDRKAKAEQVIFARQAGSAQIVLSRYTAAVIVTVVPVILLSCSTLFQAVYYANSIQAEYDLFAFVKHIGFWLLPTILVSLAVGFFLTEITDSAIAILVQGIWWFVSLFMNDSLVGSVGWNLIPRFNTIGSNHIYQEMKEQLIRNRCFYTGFAVILVVLTIFVFYKKRRGEFAGVGTILKNRKNKLEV